MKRSSPKSKASSSGIRAIRDIHGSNSETAASNPADAGAADSEKKPRMTRIAQMQKIAPSAPPPAPTAEPDSADLPPGWTSTTLGAICSKPQYGWTCKASKQGQIRYVRTTDISGGKIDWESVPFCEETPDDIEKYRVHQNDILVSRAGSVGVSYRIDEVPCDAVFASYLIRFSPLEAVVEPKYVEAFLHSDAYWQSISEFAAGIAVPNVNASKLAELEVPLPPLAEQRRMVAKLEELLGKVEASRQRLAQVPALLKRFRQAVLAAACSGRLTADWRARRAATVYPFAAETPARAVAEEPAPYGRSASAPSASPRANNSGEDTGSRGDAENAKDLPDGWESIELCQLICDGPQNGLYKPSTFYGAGTMIVRIDAFYDGTIADWSELKRVSLTENERRQYAISNGDILINRVNSPKFLGKVALVRGLQEPCVFESNMMRLSLDPARVSSEYAIIFLQCFQGVTELRKNAKHAINQSSINQDDVKAVRFILPPLPEQEEIVRRVEAMFAVADRLEARFAKARAQVDRLAPALLAKAFRGELVTQDPRDQPASAP